MNSSRVGTTSVFATGPKHLSVLGAPDLYMSVKLNWMFGAVTFQISLFLLVKCRQAVVPTLGLWCGQDEINTRMKGAA